MEYLVKCQILAFFLCNTVMVSSFNQKFLPKMLILKNMKNSIEENQKLRAKAIASLNKTDQLQKVIAKIEASLSREENHKVRQKSDIK